MNNESLENLLLRNGCWFIREILYLRVSEFKSKKEKNSRATTRNHK